MAKPLTGRQVPIANSILCWDMIEKLPPFVQYICYWTAFNNCYIKFFGPPLVELARNKKGDVSTITIDGVRQAMFKRTTVDRVPIRYLVEHGLAATLRREIVESEHAYFFLNRTPVWEMREIKVDAFGQSLNGVINMGSTADPSYPIWRPLDREAYQRLGEGVATEDDVLLLARQLVDILYAVRNNLVHAGKMPDDSTDQQVLSHALPLLKRIVESLVEKEQLDEPV